MKKDFIEKWKYDKKYQAKIKLSLYGLFIIFVTVYAIIINNSKLDNEIIYEKDANETMNENINILNIPDKYKYKITVEIDNKIIEYVGLKNDIQTTITKTVDEISTNYIYKNNDYYIEDNSIYIKTTKEEVYDIANYNYLNFNSINYYLSKSKKENNQYLIYLKDIILGNTSNDYFVILINNNDINIDYTPLIKEYNTKIEKYKVHIKIEEYKEVN